MRLQLIRNATVKLSIGGCTFLIDPCFAVKHSMPPFAGGPPNPQVDLPVPISDILDGVNIVLVSHLHSDHFDQAAISALSKHSLIFCQPGDDAAIREAGFTNVAEMEGTIPFGRVQVLRFDVMHGTGPVRQEMGPSSGFVFLAEGEPLVMWCGDTVLFPGFEAWLKRVKPEVVVTHSGGAVWGPKKTPIIMDAQQTLKVCRALPNARVIATHMEAFDHLRVSRQDLRDAADTAHVSQHHLLIPRDGDIIEVNV